MDLIKVIEQLVAFKTVTGNKSEIDNCLTYIQNTASNFGAYVSIHNFEDASPVILIANTSEYNFDALVLGHIDVVPADDNMFTPIIKDGKIFGRGTLDMKSFVAVALNSLEYVIQNNLNIKFGVILSTDEETGSKSTQAFLNRFPDLTSEVVLDNDVGGDITKIITKCKNPVFVKLISKGKASHGSTPWEGIDANEKLFHVWQNIRTIYPYFSLDTLVPSNMWIDTVHFAKINGGETSNVIAENAQALLDFRLTENSSITDLCSNLDKCLEKDTHYEIISASIPVVMDEQNFYIQTYKQLVEKHLNTTVKFEHIGGATDSREFAAKGSVIIMHSGTGNGMHAKDEYAEIDSIINIAQIQKEFLKHLSQEKTKKIFLAN